jgi:Na+/glutamate symporter
MTTDTRPEPGDILWDGLIAGALGAVTVALWFLILDLSKNQPLYTPSLLGGALLHGASSATKGVEVEPSLVAVYSGIHLGLFALFGLTTAWVISKFKQTPILGYLLVFFFVFFEFAFYVFVLVWAQPIAGQLATWAILVGNFLAVVVMGGYFTVRNPGLLRGDYSPEGPPRG